MNYEKEKKEAMKYAKKGGAYVKAIYDDKGKNELMVSGDIAEMVKELPSKEIINTKSVFSLSKDAERGDEQ